MTLRILLIVECKTNKHYYLETNEHNDEQIYNNFMHCISDGDLYKLSINEAYAEVYSEKEITQKGYLWSTRDFVKDPVYLLQLITKFNSFVEPMDLGRLKNDFCDKSIQTKCNLEEPKISIKQTVKYSLLSNELKKQETKDIRSALLLELCERLSKNNFGLNSN